MRYSSILSYNLTINALIFVKYDIENSIPNSQFFQREIDINNIYQRYYLFCHRQMYLLLMKQRLNFLMIKILVSNSFR